MEAVDIPLAPVEIARAVSVPSRVKDGEQPSELARDVMPIENASSNFRGESATESQREDSVQQLQDTEALNLSTSRSVAIVSTVAGVSFLNTVGSGILTVALPKIASDLGLSRGLILWPASIYALTCACTLLLAGAVADISGRRKVYLIGCAFYSAFTLGCGLSSSALSIIVFRALQGIAISFCLTTAVGIITNSFAAGQRRNLAFACLGAGQPVGYAVGLVLGGIFVDSIGWRFGYYIAATVNVILFVVAWWALPTDSVATNQRHRLIHDIDWVGGILASSALGILSYVFAAVSGSINGIKEVNTIVLLGVGVALLPAFVFWVGRQERLGNPAIIPNSIWKQPGFASICIIVFLTWGAFNPISYFMTLFFQDIQHLSALQTSIRFLPMVFAGFVTNMATGFLVRKSPANYLVAVSSAISAVSPILMAVISPDWIYWSVAFPAVLLSPISSDVLYTISNLIIADAMPKSKQSLAGGVFNTVSQIGNSVGLAITAVISSSVSAGITSSEGSVMEDNAALMKGYQATYYACIATFSVVALLSGFGLRKAGRVGTKRE